MADKKQPTKKTTKKPTTKKTTKKSTTKKYGRKAKAFDMLHSNKPIYGLQDCDTPTSFKAFQKYLELGMERSLDGVVKALEKPDNYISTIGNWAAPSWGAWLVRARAYDEDVYRDALNIQHQKAVKAIASARAEITIMDLQSGRLLRQYGLKVLEQAVNAPLGEHKMEVITPAQFSQQQLENENELTAIPQSPQTLTLKPHQYARAGITALKEGSALMRRSAGMTTETLEVMGTGVAADAPKLTKTKGGGTRDDLVDGIEDAAKLDARFDEILAQMDIDVLDLEETVAFSAMVDKIMGNADDEDKTTE